MDLSPLEKFGRDVGRASDDAAAPDETVAHAKHRALAGWKRGNAQSARRLVALAVVGAVLAALVFAMLPARSSMITYSVGTNQLPGALGAWIAADTESTPVRFSEGTVMTLDPGARARVTRADTNGATMLLERGRAVARVVHVNESTQWLVHAGPFDIDVVGTEFDVAWDPTREVLELRVTEGRVIVRGPLLDEGRALSTSEALRIDIQNKKSEIRIGDLDHEPRAEASEGKPMGSTDVPEENPVAVPTEVVPANPTPRDSSDKPISIPSWRALAAAGRHREAMQAVEQSGFDRIVATSPIPVLLELADEARFAGDHARARQALLRARALGERGRSAFLLGKIAADHDNAPSDAVTWFEQYLEELPSGGLAEQALGRVIEIERRLGHTARARKAAERYLQRHPGGAYETLARLIVEN